MAHVREVQRKAGRAFEVRWRDGSRERQRTFTAKRNAERSALKRASHPEGTVRPSAAIVNQPAGEWLRSPIVSEGEAAAWGDSAMTDWPDWFPPGCPPPEAADASGEFYRLVNEDPPVEADFRSNRELADAGEARATWPESKECQACGLSVTETLSDAEATRRAFGALRKKRIAVGSVDGDGKLLATPSRKAPSHHSWWRNVGDVAWQTFVVVA